MPKKRRYSIINKMSTVWKLRDQSITDVSEEADIPASTIRNWQRDYPKIRVQYYQYLDDEAKHRILVAQHRLVEKLNDLINAIDKTRINKATLNQLASSIGIITDRYLKIQNVKHIETDNNQPLRIEYYDTTTGAVTEAPPWASTNSESSETLHSGIVWSPLWEDRAGENHGDGASDTRQESLVVSTDVSNGKSGMARFEGDNQERDWHPD